VVIERIFFTIQARFYDFVFKLIGLYFSELFFIRMLLVIEKSTHSESQEQDPSDSEENLFSKR
jgi:hypothetical protein